MGTEALSEGVHIKITFFDSLCMQKGCGQDPALCERTVPNLLKKGSRLRFHPKARRFLSSYRYLAQFSLNETRKRL